MPIVNVKGTHDVYGQEADAYSFVEYIMSECAKIFNFMEVRPPVLEYSELFVRGVGESSDVVRKEMYTFFDKANRSITLRPEFTAGIMRSIVQNKMLNLNELPVKCYYCGPVFRYERPQLGRYRQFNQFGVELVGTNNILGDLEVIVLAYTILRSLGLDGVKLKINTLGDDISRNAYKVALKEFFSKHIDNMCPDCKQRFELNPLRILDCKVPEDQLIVKDAPKMSNYLSQTSVKRFNDILSALDDLSIPYEVDDTLVRGLDYYSETVFEFHYTSSEGNNYGAVGAGGHYDKLVKEIGGPDVAGVGFSFGVERIVSIMQDDHLFDELELSQNLDFYIMPLGIHNQINALEIATKIRQETHLSVDICYDDVKMGNMFKRAERKFAKFAIIIGDNEISQNILVVKNLRTQEQTEIKIDDFIDELYSLFQTEINSKHCNCDCGKDNCDCEDCDCDSDKECHCHHKKEN